ncbi:MAG TPA: pitrilysin family protein [Candidatus Krumholzibacteria bacterium]|nr:pitrilysin family protein [Candidatus Krumholzibacteria bacterium]
MHRNVLATLSLLLLCLLVVPAAQAQDLEQLESEVETFTLDNGLRFVVVERPGAPVFTYFAQVGVGGVNEEQGRTGLAHMFEHMAFKGTDEIGTEDHRREKKAMRKVDEAYAALMEARRDRDATQSEIAELEEAFEDAQDEAREYVVANQFGNIIQKNGGTGLNASTGYDVTTYFYQLPSNKLELWAYLESERFINPVMREFYTERDVVIEERRMRTDSSPVGRLLEEFLAMSYLAHPYGRPLVGYQSDLDNFTRQQCLELYDRYYVPSNVVIGLVGDLKVDDVKDLAEEYFDDWEEGPEPPRVITEEPPQRGERRVALRDPGQPFLIVGYHKPDMFHPDAPVFDVITEMIANGRSSRLHQRLVKDEKKAVAVGAVTQLPGELYPGLFINFVVPAQGVTALECEQAVLEELDRLKDEPVSAEELEGVKTRMKANFVRQVRSNFGTISTVVQAELFEDDWRQGLVYPTEIDAVTAADIQRVARETFVEKNRNVAYILTEDAEQEGATDAR